VASSRVFSRGLRRPTRHSFISGCGDSAVLVFRSSRGENVMKLFDLFTAVTVIAVVVALMIAGSEDADAQTIEYDRWSTHAYIAATQDDNAKYIASVFFFPGRCDQGVMITNFSKDAVTITVDGVQASGAVTTATVSGDALVSLVSVSATGEVNSIQFPGVIFVSGVEATGSVTTATAFVSDAGIITGVEATGSVSTVSTNIAFDVTGVSVTGNTTTATATGTAAVELTGISATGTTTTVSISTTSVIVSVANRSNRREVYVSRENRREVYVPREKSRVVYVEAA